MGPRSNLLVTAAMLSILIAVFAAEAVLAQEPSPTPTPTPGAPNRPGDGQVDWGYLVPVLLGVVISIAIPALRKTTEQVPVSNVNAFLTQLWTVLKPYLPWALLSVLVAIALLFLLEGQINTEVAAFAAGYAWDSTLQKFSGKP